MSFIKYTIYLFLYYFGLRQVSSCLQPSLNWNQARFVSSYVINHKETVALQLIASLYNNSSDKENQTCLTDMAKTLPFILLFRMIGPQYLYKIARFQSSDLSGLRNCSPYSALKLSRSRSGWVWSGVVVRVDCAQYCILSTLSMNVSYKLKVEGIICKQRS